MKAKTLPLLAVVVWLLLVAWIPEAWPLTSAVCLGVALPFILLWLTFRLMGPPVPTETPTNKMNLFMDHLFPATLWKCTNCGADNYRGNTCTRCKARRS